MERVKQKPDGRFYGRPFTETTKKTAVGQVYELVLDAADLERMERHCRAIIDTLERRGWKVWSNDFQGDMGLRVKAVWLPKEQRAEIHVYGMTIRQRRDLLEAGIIEVIR